MVLPPSPNTGPRGSSQEVDEGNPASCRRRGVGSPLNWLRESPFSKYIFHYLLCSGGFSQFPVFVVVFFMEAGWLFSITFTLAEVLPWFLSCGVCSGKSASIRWRTSWKVILFKPVLMAKAKDFNTLSALFITGWKCTGSQIASQGCGSAGEGCLAPRATGAGPSNSAKITVFSRVVCRLAA